MTIPSNISIALTSLEAQVTAAAPLENANHSTVVALQLNVANLVTSIQTALTTTTLIPNIVASTDTTLLDGWIAPPDPLSIVVGVLKMMVAANNQNELSLMRGVVGRAASNLDQL